MNETPIDWVKNPDGTQGYTWNPITGCLNNCPYCYARKLANTRLKERYLANTNITDAWKDGAEGHAFQEAHSDPFYPRFWEDRIKQMRDRTMVGVEHKHKGIFVCDMSDLFGIGVPEAWTTEVLDCIAQNNAYPKDRFYLLTKQPQNLPAWSPFPPNVYLGVSVTNQEMFDKAIHYLKMVDAKVKFLSFEPLLDHIIVDKS